MKPFGVSLLFTSYLAITIATEFAQERNVQRFEDVIVKVLALNCRQPAVFADGDVLVQAKTQFSDRAPHTAKTRSRTVFNAGDKRGNQFKNLMLGRETATKDAGRQVQKGSYIPVKSSGKRDNFMPAAYEIQLMCTT